MRCSGNQTVISSLRGRANEWCMLHVFLMTYLSFLLIYKLSLLSLEEAVSGLISVEFVSPTLCHCYSHPFYRRTELPSCEPSTSFDSPTVCPWAGLTVTDKHAALQIYKDILFRCRETRLRVQRTEKRNRNNRRNWSYFFNKQTNLPFWLRQEP